MLRAPRLYPFVWKCAESEPHVERLEDYPHPMPVPTRQPWRLCTLKLPSEILE